MKTFLEFVANNNTMIIVDEATRIKNPTANRTINIMYNLCKIVKNGRAVKEVLPYSKYRMILTGMMFTNSPYDLWSMFNFLKYDYFSCNFYAFRARYGLECRDTHPGTGRMFTRGLRMDEIQSIRRYREKGFMPEAIAAIMSTTESNVNYILKHPRITAPFKNLEELRAKIDPVCSIVKKDDCLDLPPKIYERIHVDMNVEQKRVYNELKQQFLAKYANKELSVMNKVSLIGRLQQVTGGFFPYKEEDGKARCVQITQTNPKIEALRRDLEETGSEIIIVWARFVAELKMIHQVLNKAFPAKVISLYYGGTYNYERERIIKEFKEGKVDILVANVRTAGIGLNLQRSHFQYYFSNSYSLEDRQQSEDRSHRSGQQHAVLYKDIIVKGTIDEQVYQVLQAKKSLLDYFRSKSLADFIGGKIDF
jgi:SNF2 family DNA or RNA helicase